MRPISQVAEINLPLKRLSLKDPPAPAARKTPYACADWRPHRLRNRGADHLRREPRGVRVMGSRPHWPPLTRWVACPLQTTSLGARCGDRGWGPRASPRARPPLAAHASAATPRALWLSSRL